MAETGLQLRSTVKQDNTLELTLVDVPIPTPGPDEVLVQVEATPLNPSDLALLFGPADPRRPATSLVISSFSPTNRACCRDRA